MASGVRPLSSVPRKRIEPALGSSAPEMQLKPVVFPEPFGPMRPRISPSMTSNDTLLRAMNPPNRFVRPDTVSIVLTPLISSLSSAGFARAILLLGGGRSKRTGRSARSFSIVGRGATAPLRGASASERNTERTRGAARADWPGSRRLADTRA